LQYSRHRKAIERMYTDRATISREIESESPSGETKQTQAAVYENQLCRISQKALSQNAQSEAQNDVRYETKLFIAPELDIRQGDGIDIARGQIRNGVWSPLAGKILTYTAGEPFPYSTHQEISVQRRGYA